MDSVSQLALGAAVGVATMGRRTAVWKAALWGAVAGTLPDLDVFIDHGNPIRNMVLHRAETHAPFWLTLFSLPLAAAVARLHGEWAHWRRWWLALWLALVTHPLLDAMTVYGTQLALPFSDHPFAVGSVFIIDPLYTLPLLFGTAWALAGRGNPRSLRANTAGLVLSCAYLAWGVAAQQLASRAATVALAAQGIAAERVLVMPTAFNSLLWRAVVLAGDEYLEGFHSLLDADPHIDFDRFARGNALASALQGQDDVRRLQAFSKGFYRVRQDGPQVLISDLRMGQEPTYTFTFAVATRQGAVQPLPAPLQIAPQFDFQRALPWLWRRMWGERRAPPR